MAGNTQDVLLVQAGVPPMSFSPWQFLFHFAFPQGQALGSPPLGPDSIQAQAFRGMFQAMFQAMGFVRNSAY
jgi:hypothetical protein